MFTTHEVEGTIFTGVYHSVHSLGDLFPCEGVSVADLRGGGVRDARPPPLASKFFQFHAVFGRLRQNCVFTPPPLGGFTPPPLGEILDPSLGLCPDRGSLSQRPPGQRTPYAHILTSTAGGAHPTRMHTCFILFEL